MRMSKQPKWIWADSEGKGRNVFVWFRRRFYIEKVPFHAYLHLFADSLYRLQINGKTAMEGPARFLPKFPEYDRVDLTRHLQTGMNELLVLVNARGAACFQAVPSIGGFIAWGEIDSPSFPDLATPGAWEMLESEAWDPDAEPFSFAQGPIEILDNAIFNDEIGKGSAEKKWKKPALLSNQNHWGKLKPRSIPYPSLQRIAPTEISVCSPFKENVRRYGFRIHHYDGPFVKNPSYLPFFTHLYSPRNQKIEIGLFWGEFFLNGEKLKLETDTTLGNRRRATLELQKGWNFFYGFCFFLILSRWPMIIELPASAKVEVRGLPDLDHKETFYTGQKIEGKVLPPSILKKIPKNFEEIPRFSKNWKPSKDNLDSPCREIAWDRLGKPTFSNVPAHFPLKFTLSQQGGGSIVVDLGQEYLGHICCVIEASEGTILDMAYDERLRQDSALGLYVYNPFVNTADRYYLKEGKQSIEGFHERGGRYLQLTIRNATGKVVLHRVDVRLKTVNLEETGNFSCSDPVFNWTWKIGKATLQQCLSDGWIDPWRERGLYLGDTLVEADATRKFSSDWSTEAWAIRLWSRGQFANGQMADVVPTWKKSSLCDYTLLWILMLEKYWRASGDLALVKEVFPSIPKIFLSPLWKSSKDGLWETHGELFSGKAEDCTVFIDWSVLPEGRIGVNAVLNAYRIRALELSSSMARALGKKSEALKYKNESTLLKKAFSKNFWDEESERFSPCILEKSLSPVEALHANILAVAWNIGTPTQTEKALLYVEKKMAINHECPPGHVELFFLHFALEALYAHGKTALAESVIHHHYKIMKEKDSWGLWECLDRGIQGLGSHCHGWSASPLVYFSERILGVQHSPSPSKQIVIAPESESLDWAKGTVPHPRGNISVSWHIQNNKLLMEVTLPKNLRPLIQPKGRLGRLPLSLKLNGKTVSSPDALSEKALAG